MIKNLIKSISSSIERTIICMKIKNHIVSELEKSITCHVYFTRWEISESATEFAKLGYVTHLLNHQVYIHLNLDVIIKHYVASLPLGMWQDAAKWAADCVWVEVYNECKHLDFNSSPMC